MRKQALISSNIPVEDWFDLSKDLKRMKDGIWATVQVYVDDERHQVATYRCILHQVRQDMCEVLRKVE